MKNNSRKKTKKTARIIVIVCACIVAALVIADLVIGNFLVSFALARSSVGETDVAPEAELEDETEKLIAKNAERINAETDEWLKSAKRQTVSVTSDDGLRLEGDIFPANEESHRWVIVIHGYSGTRSTMYAGAKYYSEWGYNVLTPDLRGHGESEGDYIGMGWLDRKDILKWISYLNEKDPDATIILHGVSMGAATVMMTAGEELPANVKAAVEDCGYTSVWDIFSDEAKYLFHIPEFPILYTASAFSKARAGYTFGEASSLKQMENVRIPMLFIHGSKDNFVNVDMVYELYDACPSSKKIYIAEGAGHGMSYYLDPDKYTQQVLEFLEESGVEKNKGA